MFDLREEFDRLLLQWGQNVYLQRLNKPFANIPTGQNAFSNKFEKHTVRTMNTSPSSGLANIESQEEEGVEYPTSMVFWFRWDVNPITGDRVYLTVPRYPKGFNPIYTLDFADPKYGAKGRIEFWACAGSRVRPGGPGIDYGNDVN